MRADDGAGSVLAARLVGRISAAVIDAEDIPENYLGLVIEHRPDVLMIVDAASMNAPAGSLAIIEKENIAEAGLSTHSASLNLFLMVLFSEIQPDTFILGIQPATLEFGAPISPPVLKTLDTVEQALLKLFPPAQ